MMESVTPWWRASAVDDNRHKRVVFVQDETAGSPLAFWALMQFTFVLLLAPQAYFPILASMRIALLSAGVAGLAYGFNRLSRGMRLVDFGPAIVLVFLLAAWAIVTVPFSIWPGGSVAFLMDEYFKTVLVFLLLIHVIDSRRKLNTMYWGLVLFSVPLALTTVMQFLSGDLAESGKRVSGYTTALTSNPNDMALWLNLMLPLCIALLLAARRTTFKLILAAIAGLMTIAIIATFSRAGFLTLVFIGLCYMWLLRKRPQRVWLPVLMLMAMLALPLVPDSYFSRIDTIVNIQDDDSGSAQTRLADLKVAAKLVTEQPLMGSGVGMNALAMNEARGETWIEVHNVYLEYAVDLGLPGLLLFLLLYFRSLGATRTPLRNGEDKAGRDSLFYLSEGLRVSLLAFAVAAFFHPVAYNFYFYLIAGLATAAERLFLAGEQDVTR